MIPVDDVLIVEVLNVVVFVVSVVHVVADDEIEVDDYLCL